MGNQQMELSQDQSGDCIHKLINVQIEICEHFIFNQLAA